MLKFDPERVRDNARRADTEDLLDRVTAYRAGMEPDAIDLIERELARRGVTARVIAEHDEECRRECLYDADGTALMCSQCRRPAVATGWGWYRAFRIVPMLPARFRYCRDHAPVTSCEQRRAD
jgi:hypothetical protein